MLTALIAGVEDKKARLDQLRRLSPGALAEGTPQTAFLAHRRLVDIHPFHDGNGRTARLLMNLVLIRSGYPPVSVRPEDRLDYLRALQAAQAGGDDEDFMRLLYQRLDSTLAEYLSALHAAIP